MSGSNHNGGSTKLYKEMSDCIKLRNQTTELLLDYFHYPSDSEENVKEEDNENADDIKLTKLNQFLRENKVNTNKSEFIFLFSIMKSLFGLPKKGKPFNRRLEKLIILLKADIQNLFDDDDLDECLDGYFFFMLIYVEQGIFSISKLAMRAYEGFERGSIYQLQFFYPEIREYDPGLFKKTLQPNHLSHIGEFRSFVEENDQDLEDFKRRRYEGNPSVLHKLIRKDRIDDFISYVKRTNLDMNHYFEPNVFDQFVNERYNIVRYCAAHGSLQIFKYLIKNKVDLEPSTLLFKCAIKGRNYEIIHILEEMEIIKPTFERFQYDPMLTAAGCFHHEILEYLLNYFNIQSDIFIVQLCFDANNYITIHKIYEQKQSNPEFVKLVYEQYNEYVLSQRNYSADKEITSCKCLMI